jgi:WD40 repeat protein
MSFCINPHCLKPQNTGSMLFCQSCGSELLLEGRYRVIGILGGGGFGKTYEVVERDGSKKVLKILLHNYPKAVSLFQQEAQVLSQLNHPGIPQGNGYFTFLPNGVHEPLHCLVMDKIEGLNLEQYVSQRQYRPINQELAVEWLKQLCEILKQVHSQNFFHRDIKPSNVMLTGEGQLVLIDFGAAREVTSTYMQKQAVGQVTGIHSPGYTPPEQLNGQAVLTSDFFAIGRTFVFLLTGRVPTDTDIYDPNSDEVRWRNFAPDVSPLFATLIDDLMRRSPSQRPQNTQEVLHRLALVEKDTRQKHSTGRQSFVKKGNFQRFNFTAISRKKAGILGTVAVGLLMLGLAPRLFNIDTLSLLSANPTEKWAKNLSLANTFTGHSEPIASVAISPDGQTVASASHDQTIKLWSLQTGKLARTVYGHTQPVLSVAMSPDGQQIVSGSLDETIKQWSISTGQQIRSLKTDGYVAWNNAIAISRDSQTLATGSTDKTVRLWNYSTGQRLRTLYGHSLPVLSVIMSPDGQTLASGSSDKTVRLWNINTGQPLKTLVGHTGWVTCLAVSSNNQIVASGSLDKTIKLWNVTTGELIRTLKGHNYSVMSIVISPDGKTIASGGLDGEIRLWNLETGQLLHTIGAHSKQVVSLAMSQDGKILVSGSSDDTIKVWQSN